MVFISLDVVGIIVTKTGEAYDILSTLLIHKGICLHRSHDVENRKVREKYFKNDQFHSTKEDMSLV